MNQFEQINKGFNSVFQFGKLSLGIVIPIENYAHSSVPTLQHHLERVDEDNQFEFSGTIQCILKCA